MSNSAIESAPTFSQEEVAAAESAEQEVYEQAQRQYLNKRIILLRAENTRLREELGMLRAAQAGLAEPLPDSEQTA